jgi:outer membrane protein assembly factor BamB
VNPWHTLIFAQNWLFLWRWIMVVNDMKEMLESLTRNWHAPEPCRAPKNDPRPWASGLLTGFLGGVGVGMAGFFLAMSLYEPQPARTGKKPVCDPKPVEQAAGLVSKKDKVEEPSLLDSLKNQGAMATRGFLQFRGNPTHTWYGEGPVPRSPKLLWRFPDEPMCAESTVGKETKEWCGTGWTGQPVLWEHSDGVTELIVGAYDRAVHFVDAETGRRTRPDYLTGDLVKGTVTLDPDGYPLLYFGSRDNKFRIVALDRPHPTLLWSMDAYDFPGLWNDDWDGNPSVVNGLLLEGGENGNFYAILLNRSFQADGLVRVSPEFLAVIPTWTEQLIKDVGDVDVSIENSVAVFHEKVFFANSAGRVMGLDLTDILRKKAPVTFDFWMGDDVDASIVIDGEGMLYVAAELERFLPIAEELGQLVKLNPNRPQDPVVWSLKVPPEPGQPKGGIWSTPALDAEVLYVTTQSGKLLAVDRETGTVLFMEEIGRHAWSSPVIIDRNLLVATCTGELLNFSIEDPRNPVPVWSLQVHSGGCIESTPVVWKGKIFFGSRDGFLYAFGE